MGFYILDKYSLAHFAFGVLAYFLHISLVHWVILHALFEIIENSQFGMYIINEYVKYVWIGGKDVADSFINSMSDNIFAYCGWIFAYYVGKLSDKYIVIPNQG